MPGHREQSVSPQWLWSRPQPRRRAPHARPVRRQRAERTAGCAREVRSRRSSVIDLSASGVLFETAAPLTQESTIVLEFSGPTKTRADSVARPALSEAWRRSTTASDRRAPAPSSVRSRLKDLVTGTTPARRDTPSSADESVDTSHADRRQVSRRTSHQRLHQRLQPVEDAHARLARRASAKETQFVELTELDALFFLRGLARCRRRRARAARSDGTVRPQGRPAPAERRGDHRARRSTTAATPRRLHVSLRQRLRRRARLRDAERNPQLRLL